MKKKEKTKRQLETKTVIPFTIISFAITWGIALLLILFYDQMESIFGEVGYTNPMYILAVYAPAIAAICLILKYHGTNGLGQFLRRLTLWRMSLGWWAFLIIGVPVLFYLAAFIEGTYADAFPFSPWDTLISALIIMLLLGPIEEFGWRGFMVPLLQRKYTPLITSLIVGVIWGVWHLPAFVIGGTPHSEWVFFEFFVGAIALSIIMTAMFNSSKGSVLVVALLHFQLNNPIWPDAQRWATIIFAFAAIVVLILFRQSMFQRTEEAIVSVLYKD